MKTHKERAQCLTLMEEEDAQPSSLSRKQEPRLPSTEGMATGDALQTIARAGWRVAAFDHADDFWKKSAANEMPYQFGHVVLETNYGLVIGSHKGISPPAFVTK